MFLSHTDDFVFLCLLPLPLKSTKMYPQVRMKEKEFIHYILGLCTKDLIPITAKKKD